MFNYDLEISFIVVIKFANIQDQFDINRLSKGQVGIRL